jgi:mRNA interferase YafQ
VALQIERSSQFKRDYKRMKRQGADLTKLMDVIQQLAAGKPLEQRYLDHRLQGN